MRKIKLAKIEVAEVEVIQRELLNFFTYKNSILIGQKNSDHYFSSVLLIDIAQHLCLELRGIIERNTSGFATLNFSASEACVILQCCTQNSKFQNDFEKYVLQKYSAKLHKELTNLI